VLLGGTNSWRLALNSSRNAYWSGVTQLSSEVTHKQGGYSQRRWQSIRACLHVVRVLHALGKGMQ
jgi:hypothetical protein